MFLIANIPMQTSPLTIHYIYKKTQLSKLRVRVQLLITIKNRVYFHFGPKFQPIRAAFGSAAAAAKHSIFQGRAGNVQLQPQEAVPNRLKD